MSQIDFDHYSDNYDEVLAKSIGFMADSDFFDRFKINCLGEWFSVSSQSTILDFGSGIGKLSALLASKFPDSQIYGYDVSEKSLLMSRKRYQNVRNVSFENDLNENRKYDIILASNVFHHIKSTERLSTLQGLKKLLKPKGSIVIFEHNPFNPFTRYIVNRCSFDADVELISRSRFTKLAFCCGLHVGLKRYIVMFPWDLKIFRIIEGLFSQISFGAQYVLLLTEASLMSEATEDAGNMKIKCHVCKENSSFYHQHPEADLYQCRNCGHVFSVNVKAQSIYTNKYFSQTHNNWFLNPDIKTYRRIYGFIKQNKQDAAALMDLGCGNGRFLDYIRSQDQDLRLIGVDLSNNPNRNNIKFIQSDIKNLKIDEQYDFITLLAFIEHVIELDGLASTLINISKKGSYVIILTINEDGLLYRSALILKKLNVNGPFNRLYSAHHVQHFTANSLIEFMKRAGYEHVKTIHHNIHMKALDIEANNLLAKFIYKCGVYLIFILGAVLKKTYLQTAFFRKT